MKVGVLFFFLLSPFLATGARADGPANVRVRVQSDVSIPAGETVATAVAIMGTVKVDGTVTGDAVAVFGDIVVGPGGSVEGDAVSVAGEIKRAPGARVGGREVAIESPHRSLGKFVAIGLPFVAAALALVGALVVIASTVGFLVLVVAILVLFERNVAAARQAMVEDPFRTFLIGFLVFIGVIPLSVFLAATIIGVPLALAVLAVLMAAVCLGAVAVCEWIGAEIARRAKRPLKSVWAGLLGLAVLFAVGLIPWLGGVVHIVVILLGIGAVTRTRFRGLPDAAGPIPE